MKYHCCDERRLEAVKKVGALNGIEYLEVSDSEAPKPALRQRTLFVRLLHKATGLTTSNVVIDGQARHRPVPRRPGRHAPRPPARRDRAAAAQRGRASHARHRDARPRSLRSTGVHGLIDRPSSPEDTSSIKWPGGAPTPRARHRREFFDAGKR
jgi:hypothetical protein